LGTDTEIDVVLETMVPEQC